MQSVVHEVVVGHSCRNQPTDSFIVAELFASGKYKKWKRLALGLDSHKKLSYKNPMLSINKVLGVWRLSTLIAFFLILNSVSSPLLYSQIETIEIETNVQEVEAPIATVASILDSQSRTHVVWVSNEEAEGGSVNYAIVGEEGVLQRATINFHPGGGAYAPQITLNQQDGAHVVYFLKRDRDGSTRNGNYAIMYAGDSDGDGIFEVVTQASTNSGDPLDIQPREFDCYVNGRPTIIFTISGEIVVYYFGDPNGEFTDFEDSYISATLQPDGFTFSHKREFFMDKQDVGHFAAGTGFSAPAFGGSFPILASFEISEYDPVIFQQTEGDWSFTRLPVSEDKFDIGSVEVLTDTRGRSFVTWLDENSNGATIVEVSENGVDELLTTIPFANFVGGNLIASYVEDGLFYFAYKEQSSSTVWILTYNNATEELSPEWEFENLGKIPGKRNLVIRNGFLSLVTTSGDEDRIFITRGRLSDPAGEPPGQGGQGFLDSGTSLGAGWYYFENFGYLNADFFESSNSSGWIFHDKLGWLYLIQDETGLFFWDLTGSWFYTSLQTFPYLYNFQGSRWLFFDVTSGIPSNRWFFDFSSDEWISF